MSSDMRVTDEQVWAAVCAWRDVYDAEYMHSGSTMGNDEQAMRAALEAAILARTEAGADYSGCYALAASVETLTGEVNFLCNKERQTPEDTPLYTHPQDASAGDAAYLAMIDVRDMAVEAHAHWDNDRDSKVGKMLLAMAGQLKGYDSRADKFNAAIAALQQKGSGNG